MLFNSPAFAVFLVVSLPIYWVLGPARRKLALLGLSYAFYAFWSVPYLLLLAAVTLAAYFSAFAIEKAEVGPKRVKALLGSLALPLGSLVVFKYAGVFGALARMSGGTSGVFDRVLVPLGISYYTFKLMSYVVDVYWEKIPAEKDPVAFALYPAFFPQILSGPIQRAGDFLSQVRRPILNDPDRITSGLRLILFGYFKKIVVADSLAPFVNQVTADPMGYNTPCVVLALWAFTFQLYADFSGFTDIAIGTGRLFGIQSPPNFNNPFYAPNLQVFWRNWHMTLTRWMADYVFLPLRMALRSWESGGIAVAIAANFIAIGLWHGAAWSFLVFGIFHAAAMCGSVFTLQWRDTFFERQPLLAQGRRFWAPFITFNLWTVSLILFRGGSLPQIGRVIQAVWDLNFTKPWVLFYGKWAFLTAVVMILVMEIGHWMVSSIRARATLFSKPRVVRWAAYYTLVFLILVYFKQGSQEFIYFQF